MAIDSPPVKNLPRHVGIIMDGNGRWAEARGLQRTAGHREGAEAVRRTVEASGDLGIEYLTLFGFSSENWKRPETEINDLMALLTRYLRGEIAEMHKQNVRFRVIGGRDAFSPEIIALINEGENLTRDNNRLNFTVALNYGGRADITMAARRAAAEVSSGRLDPRDITEERFSGWLWTAGMPDPDLIIRTSGEQRVSNFLLWQSAYSEFVFLDTLWPDFSRDDLMRAMTEFGRRERRYGASRG